MIKVAFEFNKAQYNLFKQIIEDCATSIKMQTKQVAQAAAEQVMTPAESEQVNNFMLNYLLPQGELLEEIGKTLNAAEQDKPRIILAR